MLSWLNDFKASASKSLTQFNNKTFKDAAMAVCALVSASDGSVSKEEKSKVAGLIRANELLQVFNAEELRDTFLAFCDKATDDFARLDLLNIVRKLKGNDAQADTALKVALIIANSDGSFSDTEKKVVQELCTLLNVPAANYGA
jgi:tellurite resistance protein TerB